MRSERSKGPTAYFCGFSLVSVAAFIEHLYDHGMLSSSICELRDVVERLDVSVDPDDLAEVFRLRDALLAKAMRPLREFDTLELYQPTKATSTKTFLEKSAGLSAGEAGAAVVMARKLGKMPLTEAAFVDGTLPSGTVRAIVANVVPRVIDRYVAHEAENIDIVAPLTPSEAATVMQSWAVRAHACADADNDKPPRADEYFHSPTLGGRYETKGSFSAETGGPIATALRVAQDDNPRDHDTRSPAEKRAEALADIARFYLDFRARLDTDPDTPTMPKRRNLPHVVYLTETADYANGGGGRIMDGPAIDHSAIEAMSCTAQLLRLLFDEHGAIRSYDLMPASVTDALFGAVAARDQGCRWPGCHKKPWHCDLHHIHQRQHGGANSPCNCCLFCRYHHHRGAHDPSIKLHLARDGTLTVTYADGSTETSHPPNQQRQLPHTA